MAKFGKNASPAYKKAVLKAHGQNNETFDIQDYFKVIGEILTPGIVENQEFTEKETEYLTIGK